jgi:hypothetical protein
MHYGIHLPHAGERASPILIRRCLVQAEALGIADVWVSEHIILPAPSSSARCRSTSRSSPSPGSLPLLSG